MLGLDVFVLLEWDIDWLDVVLLLNNWLFLDVLLRLAIPGKGYRDRIVQPANCSPGNIEALEIKQSSQRCCRVRDVCNAALTGHRIKCACCSGVWPRETRIFPGLVEGWL